MPNYRGGEDRPAPSGEPLQTFPPYRPPEDGPGIFVLRKHESGEEPPDMEAGLEEALKEETRRGRERRREKDMPGGGPGEAGGDCDARVQDE